MKKAKQTLPFIGPVLSALPYASRMASVKKLLPSRLNRESIEFGPGIIDSIHKICCVLPDERLMALMGMSLVHTLHNRCGDAQVLLIAESATVAWCQSIMPNAQICSYEANDRFLISAVLREIHASIELFKPDMVVYVSPSVDPSLCWLVGKSGARIRIGFSRDIFPCINVSIPADTTACFVDQLAAVLVPLGIAPVPFRKVSIDAQARSECEMMLSEMRIPVQAKMVLIDGDGVSASLEQTILLQLVAKIQSEGYTPVVYTSGAAAGMQGVNWSGIPVLGPLPVSRLAALIGRSIVTIAGVTVFAEMTRLIGTKLLIIGLAQTINRAFKPSSRCSFIALDEIDQGSLVSLLMQTIIKAVD